MNDASPTKPVVIGEPAQPPAKSHPPIPTVVSGMVSSAAYKTLGQGGRLTGKAGESMKEKNWLDAEHQILEEVEARAFKIWDEQGRPSAAAGEAVRELNKLRRGSPAAQGDRRRVSSTPARLVFDGPCRSHTTHL